MIPTFAKADFVHALLAKVSNDNKTTILGVAAAGLLATNVDWAKLLHGDATAMGTAAGALIAALLGYYTNKPNKAV